MRNFAVTAYDVASGAVVDTFKSILGLIAASTTGHRGRIRSITVGGAGGAAQDIQVALRLVRSDGTTGGTGTAVTPTKFDAASLAANLTAKKNYTAEPTTLATVFLWEGSINARGTIIKEWAAGEGPRIAAGETLLLQASPGAATAVTLNAAMEWEED